MAEKSIIGSVLQEAGIITIEKRRCVCGVCNATGRIDTLNIKHKPDCTAYQAVKTFIESLQDGSNLIPRVEDPIELDTMLPYYAEASSEEYAVADGIATCIFAAATKKDREKLRKRIEQFEPACMQRPDIIEAVMQNGLESPTDRVNFRSWLIFTKVWERRISLLEAQHYELEVEFGEMIEMFNHAFRVC